MLFLLLSFYIDLPFRFLIYLSIYIYIYIYIVYFAFLFFCFIFFFVCLHRNVEKEVALGISLMQSVV